MNTRIRLGIIAAAFTLLLLVPHSPIVEAQSLTTTHAWSRFHRDLRNTGESTSPGPRSFGIVWSFQTGSIVFSSPAVVEGTVFIASRNGVVYALNQFTGVMKWSRSLSATVESSPAVANGKVFIATDGAFPYRVHALDANGGSLLWTFEDLLPCPLPGSTSGVDSSPAIVDGLVLIGSMQCKFLALKEVDGTLVWSFSLGPTGHVFSSPAVDSGTVFFAATDGRLYALDELTGQLKWKTCILQGGCTDSSFAPVFSSPSVDNSNVYVGSDQLYALDKLTGSVVWTFATDTPTHASPANTGGTVFIGTNGGTVYGIDKSSQTAWSFLTGDDVISSPAAASGVVYVGSNDGRLYALDQANGRLLHSITLGGTVASSPAIADSMIFVGNSVTLLDGSTDGFIFALGRVNTSKTFSSSTFKAGSRSSVGVLVSVENIAPTDLLTVDLTDELPSGWKVTSLALLVVEGGTGYYIPSAEFTTSIADNKLRLLIDFTLGVDATSLESREATVLTSLKPGASLVLGYLLEPPTRLSVGSYVVSARLSVFDPSLSTSAASASLTVTKK